MMMGDTLLVQVLPGICFGGSFLQPPWREMTSYNLRHYLHLLAVYIVPNRRFDRQSSFPLSQEAEEGSKDDEMARYLQKAAHKASLVAAATARGHMKKMRIVQVTGCTMLLKCSILIQTHTRNRWVSAIEFGQIHKVWETTLGWGMLGGDNSNWGPFCYNYTCFHKLVAVWCQMFLNMLYHMFDIQRADDLSLWFYHWSKLERRFQSSTLKMTNHFCLNW